MGQTRADEQSQTPQALSLSSSPPVRWATFKRDLELTRILRRDLGATNTTNNPVLVNNNHYNLWTVDGGRMDYLKAGVYADQDSLLDLRYDYDAVGNLLSILDVPNSNQKQCFTYDANNRLLTARVGINDATCSGSVGNGEYPDETYSYSTTSGNLSSKTGMGTYTYDSTQPHAVDAVTGYTYLYDTNGNMTRRDPTGADYYDFLYDTENRLSQAKKNGAVLATFTYDGDGNRVKSVLGSTTTLFVGQHYETSAGVVTKYYAAGGERVAMRQGSNFYWLFSDHLGSTSKVANSSGTLQSQQLYKAWGETRYTSGTLPTRYTYTGQYSYATSSANDFGLFYYGARFYDNSLGRFVSPDSIIPAPSIPTSWDRYAYSFNRPTVYKDPTGHRPCGEGETINCDGTKNPIAWNNPVKPMDKGGGYDYSDTHKAIDLNPDSKNNPNPEIVASSYGTVYSSTGCMANPCEGKTFKTNSGYGNMLIIGYNYENLPANIQSNIPTGATLFILYAHLNEPSILEEGDAVVPGQVIGNVGTSGNSDGVHLHMELKVEQRLNFPQGDYSTTDGYTDVFSKWHSSLMRPLNPYGFFPIH